MAFSSFAIDQLKRNFVITRTIILFIENVKYKNESFLIELRIRLSLLFFLRSTRLDISSTLIESFAVIARTHENM